MDSQASNPPKKQCTDSYCPKDEYSLTPRSYQIEILETARKQNTIACLGTGTGKTFIAVMLIQVTSDEVRLPFEKGGKRIFFLVPTVPLVHQQMKTIEKYSDLKVKGFSGDMNVDAWSAEKWTEEFKMNEVLVMTAEIFTRIVDHTFIPYHQIKLIIFDECHGAQGDHPYARAMKCFANMNHTDIPKIFGLSASLINGKCKPSQLEKQLRNLEITLRSSITTTSDIMNIQNYGADPDEYLVCFNPYEIETELLKELADLNKIVQQKSKKKSSEYIFESDLEFFEKPQSCLNSLEVTLKNLGPWCATKAAEIFLEELSIVLHNKHFLMKHEEESLLLEVVEFLKHFKTECERLSFNFHDIKSWPHKLQRLLEIFLAVKNSERFLKKSLPVCDINFNDDPVKYHQMLKNKEFENNSDVQICSIVFVEQRITAYVLYKWILVLKKFFGCLNFLNPEYIVGHGTTGVKKTSMSEKKQKGLLTDFRNNKCNLLISTRVLEEGMDVKQCNIVIRFDLPKDFRGYVQSKGRARAKNSIYVLMSEVGVNHGQFCLDICNYKTIEKMLLDKCHNRSLPSDEEIQMFLKDSPIPPYMPYGESGPRITMVSAISLINQYCASLPSDMATNLTAKWAIKETDPENPVKEYECTLKMPINSPLRVPIVGQKMPQKRLAKMAAALKACQLLDELGELNEHLVPASSLLQKTIEEELGPEEEEDGKGAIPGTKKRRQIYEKHVPVFFNNSLPVPLLPCYLHILKMKLVEPLPKALNPRNRPIIDPADTSRGLGILLSRKLPKVNAFPVFTKMGKVEVTVTISKKKFSLSEAEMRKVEAFHQFIFSDALGMVEKKIFSPSTSAMPCLVVPVNKDKLTWIIDFNFITEVQEHSYHTFKKSKTSDYFISSNYNKNDFLDAVVIKLYKTNEFKSKSPSLYHVTLVSDLTPNDMGNFSECLTFKEYYKQKYNIEIKDDQQHLIETFKNDAVHNWKPIYVSVREVFEDFDGLSKSKHRRMGYKEFLVPELCTIHPFPSSFLLKVQCLPTMLFRIHSLLLAEELRQDVASTRFIGIPDLPRSFEWPYFGFESSDKDLRKKLNELKQLHPIPCNVFVPQDIAKSDDNKIETFMKEIDLENHPGPNPSILLQALTAKSTGDEFNLERLEMIGDSFLKYVVSVRIYIKYPTFDEGKLTRIRIRLIQNLHLYQQAKKKKLPEYLICTTFNCHSTWLPPCYTVNEVIDEKILKKTNSSEASNSMYNFYTKQIISDKCIADAVEALIGAYLLCCGQKGALMFMSWLGLNPLPGTNDSEVTKEDFLRWPPEPPSSIVGQVSDVQDTLQKLTDGMDRFEKKIGYEFKDKALLLQAFTHPSFFRNEITDCYQRLEFLGDAILDFLITRQLYEDPNDHSPGKLTDLRSALVNNIYFASVAVKYEYNKYLKMLSEHLFGLMKYFIDELQNSEAFEFFMEHGYYLEEIECFDLDEIEVPKALGDIFESVAGAIYLDSGMSLDVVWAVYYPMISPAMRHLTEHVPMSPVRKLYEALKTKDVFKDYEQRENKCYIKVILPNGEIEVGTGPNKKVAKRSAAKRALAKLRKQGVPT